MVIKLIQKLLTRHVDIHTHTSDHCYMWTTIAVGKYDVGALYLLMGGLLHFVQHTEGTGRGDQLLGLSSLYQTLPPTH